MKQIEGKATRVQKYDRMFFWSVPTMSAYLIYIGFGANDWNPMSLFLLIPGIAIGVVIGVAFRNVP